MMGAIARVEMNTEKLNEIFVDLRLDEHPKLVSRWEPVEKTTESLQLICEFVKQGVPSNLPSAVQFAHLLDRNRDWLPANANNVLSMFVQDFATREFCGNLDLLGRKMESDKVYEDWLCRDMARNTVPNDAQFLLEDGKVDDPLFGPVDSFPWKKKTYVTRIAVSAWSGCNGISFFKNMKLLISLN